MSPRKESRGRAGSAVPAEGINEVVLVGRVSAAGEERELPSGDVLSAFRVVVDRGTTQRGRQSVDALECVAWTPRLRRSVATWRVGDVVRVEGAVRRRFFRSAGGVVSRVEVEVLAARLIRRATSA